MRRVAMRLFSGEVESVSQLWDRLVGQSGGTLRPDDPIAQAAIRAIERAYAPDGLYHKRWLTNYGTLIGETMAVGGKNVSAALGFRFDISNPLARTAVEQRATQLATYVGQTSAERVTSIMAEATQTGRSTRDVARAIRTEAFGGEISAARAKLIARTESRTALNKGEYLAATEGGVEVKTWEHSGNPNPREMHLALDQKTKPLDEPFVDGLIQPMMYPCDPNGSSSDIINCGCAVSYSA